MGETASQKMAVDGAGAGKEMAASAASAGAVPVCRIQEVEGVSVAWMSLTTVYISFCVLLIA